MPKTYVQVAIGATKPGIVEKIRTLSGTHRENPAFEVLGFMIN
jgi:hypothetical protein